MTKNGFFQPENKDDISVNWPELPESVYNDERLVSKYDKMAMATDKQDLVFRLRERARIRRQIPGRKSVEENKPDRISDLLEEAALEIEQLRTEINEQIS